MKTIKILSIAMLLVAAISCGSDDEPDPNTDSEAITRVQDGDGKVFLEKGQLVSATTNFTSSQLNDAIANYEWEREYVIYYDNKHISDRTEHRISPHKIHTNGTIEYDSTFHKNIPQAKIGYDLFGKNITTKDQGSWESSYEVTPITMTVIALDFNGTDSGRMITDMAVTWDVDGFDSASCKMRMVWNGVRQQ